LAATPTASVVTVITFPLALALIIAEQELFNAAARALATMEALLFPAWLYGAPAEHPFTVAETVPES
jgi:hypothetical protein